MPKVAKLSKLTPALQVALDRRLRNDGYGNLQETALWLREHGVTIGKSALGVYALGLKRTAVVDLGATLGLDSSGVVQLRLRCAEIAAALGGEVPFVTQAEQVLAWAVEPVAQAPRSATSRRERDDDEHDE